MMMSRRRRPARFGSTIAPVTIAALVALLATAACAGTRPAASQELPRSSPEEQGVSSSGILSFVDAADRQIDTMHSFILVRHGRVVAEAYWSPFDAETRHVLFSLTKSFTSTAVGFAVAEGKISLDDPVLKFFPEDAPAAPSDNLKAMRVRDLLCMSSGQHAEANVFGSSDPWTKTFLAQPVEHKPGTFFLYNTPGSYMLSAIVQKATGMPTSEYLRTRLFEPLGFQDPVWDKSPQGITIGGYGMRIRTREIARFGQLYLQKGEWNGKRVLPAGWAETATSRQTSNGSNPNSDWDQGYGYQFWRCRHNAVRGDGAFGQYCIMIPEQDAVVAITSGVRDMQAVMNLVWNNLLPAMKPGALPADDAARKQLDAKVASLRVRMPQGTATPSVQVSGRTFAFPANDQKVEAVALEPGKDGRATLTLRVGGAEQKIPVGANEWAKGRLSYGIWTNEPVAASGAWTAPDTYTAKICFYESPFSVTLSLKFAGDQLTYDSEYNVAFGPTKQPQLVGKAGGS